MQNIKYYNEMTAGGKRPGAGRKKGTKPVKEKVAFKLDPDVVRIIKEQENQAVFVESAVLAAHEALTAAV